MCNCLRITPKNPDVLLLHYIGAFYEMFHDADRAR
jgi:DNA mismatch repair ATPase MutS